MHWRPQFRVDIGAYRFPIDVLESSTCLLLKAPSQASWPRRDVVAMNLNIIEDTFLGQALLGRFSLLKVTMSRMRT